MMLSRSTVGSNEPPRLAAQKREARSAASAVASPTADVYVAGQSSKMTCWRANDGCVEIALRPAQLRDYMPESVLTHCTETNDTPSASLTLEYGGPRALQVLKRAIEDKQAGLPPGKLAAEELQEVLLFAHCYHISPLMTQTLNSLTQLPLAQAHAWLQGFVIGDATAPYDLIESVMHALPQTWKIDFALSLCRHPTTPQSEDALRALGQKGWIKAGDALPSEHAWLGLPKNGRSSRMYRQREHDTYASAETTLLGLAVASNHVSWVESLLDAPGGATAVNMGWRMNSSDDNGSVRDGQGLPLHIALRMSGAAMTRLLLERGAKTVSESFSSTDPTGLVSACEPSCLDLAVYSGDAEKVDLIVRHESKPWSEKEHRKAVNLAHTRGRPDLASRIPVNLTLKERIFGVEVPKPDAISALWFPF